MEFGRGISFDKGDVLVGADLRVCPFAAIIAKQGKRRGELGKYHRKIGQNITAKRADTQVCPYTAVP